MSKELKDYLHLYLGCKVRIESIKNDFIKEDYRLKDLYGKVGDIRTMDKFILSLFKDENSGVYELKPILRPLSSMTEEEFLHIGNYPFTDEMPDKEKILIAANFIAWNFLDLPVSAHNLKYVDEFDFKMMFEITRYFLSRGFDLFNLIPDGLAIDKTSLTPKT